MNAPFQFTPQATEDWDHIWSFITADSEEAADSTRRLHRRSVRSMLI